jgi:nucleoside-diphosphate-sugar epimerase
MRVLLTGAAGFIGSSLARTLLERGAEVAGVDAFTGSYDPGLKRANVEPLLARPGFTLAEADLRTAPLAPLLRGVTHVAHLAALPGVRSSWGDAFGDYTGHNVLATQRLLEAARDVRLERFVLASSSSVYGAAPESPTPETAPRRPLSPYGVTKLAAEALAFAYREAYSVPAVALRYFTVYGPGQRPDMGFHRFFEAARRGAPVTVYGDGGQSRDFTYVGDAVRATVACLDRPAPEFAYNVGGGHSVSVGEVLDRIERVTGIRIAREHTPVPPGDPRATSADTTRARRDLDYAPRTELTEGLARQWAWHRSR